MSIQTTAHGKATHLVRAPEGRAKAKEAPTPAAPRVHVNSATKHHYKPEADMLAPPARRGADLHQLIPSRMGNRLHYRDGRVVEMGERHAT